MKNYETLRWGTIVGIIDAYDAVHSIFVDFDSRTENLFHEHHFPNQTHKRWRWDFNDSIKSSVLGEKIEIEDLDKIERHITKKYGIPFWENGMHDMDWFMEGLKKGEK